MSKRARRRYTPEQKAALVRQHVICSRPRPWCSLVIGRPSWEQELEVLE